MSKDIIHRPKCPECGEPMLFSFCVAHNEYICVLCGIAKPFCHGLKEIETTQLQEDNLKLKYKDDIKRLAYTQGGAMCCECNQTGGNNCKNCKFPDEFKYFGKGKK